MLSDVTWTLEGRWETEAAGGSYAPAGGCSLEGGDIVYYWGAGTALIVCLGGSRGVLVAVVGVVRRGKRVGCTVSDHGTSLRRHVRKQNVLGETYRTSWLDFTR
jgi:hypothetical protein